jgi:mannose-6-phosphate isomerase
VAEIQQASDTTFRLFDWNRVDANGKSRPLHIEQALEVIDFERGPVELIRQADPNRSRTNLVSCDKFVLDRLSAAEHHVQLNDSFAIVTVPEGSAEIHFSEGSLHLTRGQTSLIPASLDDVHVVVQDGSTVLLASLP